MKNIRNFRYFLTATCLAVALGLVYVPVLQAKTAKEIDASVEAAMDRFKTQVKGADEYLKAAKGYLVMPEITKAGFFVGGSFGEGALHVGGKAAGYYRIISGSLGFTFGAEKYDMLLIYMTDEALKKFQDSEGWEAGVDGSVTMVNVGAAGSVSTLKSQSPIVGFVFDQKGLMGDVSAKGAKFTKFKPE